MHRHEKKAFLKFFLTYFFSVALLILAAGYFYCEQARDSLIKAEEFSLIKYVRHIKTGESLAEFTPDYQYSFMYQIREHIDIRNFTITDTQFIKYLPMHSNHDYIKVEKSRAPFDRAMFKIRAKIIAIQILLLIAFAVLSYRLARNALKPLQESISKLDRFAKDLIHDLNTPVTSIKLNMKLLGKNPHLQGDNALMRLNKSVQTISELHQNLTILLQEETFQMQEINLCEIVHDIVQIQKPLYPNIDFQVECKELFAKLNSHALKQILQNIISNACKYSSSTIRIYTDQNSLYIEDDGKGIKEPQKIFERSYSGEHSSGIGLDIVKRLASAMDITIDVTSNPNGTTFILTFI